MAKNSHTPNMPSKMTPTSQRVNATPKGNSKVMRPMGGASAGKKPSGKNATLRGASHVSPTRDSQTVEGSPRRSS